MLLIGFFYQLCRLLKFGIHQLLLQFLMLEYFVNVLREKRKPPSLQKKDANGGSHAAQSRTESMPLG